jgi:hypothetical protein
LQHGTFIKNENKLNETCDDIFMNEVMEEHNVEKEYEINPSLQFEIVGNLQIDNEQEIVK